MTLKTWLGLGLALACVAPQMAAARSHKQHNAIAAPPVPISLDGLSFDAPQIVLPTPAVLPVALTAMVPTPVTTGEPVVQSPLQRLSCVPYARLRSGLQIFGDARLWWNKARDLYAQVTNPVVDAVMVFSGSKRISRGHVAVVTQVVSPREIRVDHANWQNHGEIDLNMPVLDVSPNNDWSQVRVWNVNTNTFGSHVYKISGFISKDRTVAER
jgi:hypothetical protein